MEFERILSATGPYAGHLMRPSSMRGKNPVGKPPQKIAWLQCVGSRDINRCDNGYCSSVCCMYAVKQAVMAKDHSNIRWNAPFSTWICGPRERISTVTAKMPRKTAFGLYPSRIHTVDAVAGHR